MERCDSGKQREAGPKKEKQNERNKSVQRGNMKVKNKRQIEEKKGCNNTRKRGGEETRK